jgi:hypothetical protein
MGKEAFPIGRCPCFFFATLLLLAPATSASWASITQPLAPSDASLGLAFAGAHLGGATPPGLLKMNFAALSHRNTPPILAGSFFAGTPSSQKHQAGALFQPRVAASPLSPARGRSFAGIVTATLVKQEKAERTTNGHKVSSFAPHA